MTHTRLHQAHYATATDARILKSRAALRNAFLDLIATRPLEQVSIRSIATKANIGYNTFFRHYANKESLLEEIAADEIHALIELAVTTLDASDSLAACRALCQYVGERDALWSNLLTGGAAAILREQFVRRCRELATERVSGTDVLPAEIGANLVASGTIEVLAWWLSQPRRLAIDEIAAIYDRLVVASIVGAYQS